jgi:hypothetical protein
VSGVAAWAPTALIGGPAGLAVGIAAGLAAYWWAAGIVKVLAHDDAAWLDGAVGGGLGGAAGRAIRRLGAPA